MSRSSRLAHRRQEVRFYDVNSGKLRSLSTNPFAKDPMAGRSHITAYVSGALHRKFYLANNLGEVYMVNSKNAEQIKAVNRVAEDRATLRKIEEVNHTHADAASNLQEVTCMVYISEEKILVVGSFG